MKAFSVIVGVIVVLFLIVLGSVILIPDQDKEDPVPREQGLEPTPQEGPPEEPEAEPSEPEEQPEVESSGATPRKVYDPRFGTWVDLDVEQDDEQTDNTSSD